MVKRAVPAAKAKKPKAACRLAKSQRVLKVVPTPHAAPDQPNPDAADAKHEGYRIIPPDVKRTEAEKQRIAGTLANEQRKHDDFVARMVERGYTEKQVRLLAEWYLRVRKSQ